MPASPARPGGLQRHHEQCHEIDHPHGNDQRCRGFVGHPSISLILPIPEKVQVLVRVVRHRASPSGMHRMPWWPQAWSSGFFGPVRLSVVRFARQARLNPLARHTKKKSCLPWPPWSGWPPAGCVPRGWWRRTLDHRCGCARRPASPARPGDPVPGSSSPAGGVLAAGSRRSGERGAPAGPPSVVPGESRPTHRRGHTHLQGINTRVARASLLCRMET